MARIRYSATQHARYSATYEIDHVSGTCGHRHRSVEAAARCQSVLLPALLATDGDQWRELNAEERQALREAEGRY